MHIVIYLIIAERNFFIPSNGDTINTNCFLFERTVCALISPCKAPIVISVGISIQHLDSITTYLILSWLDSTKLLWNCFRYRSSCWGSRRGWSPCWGSRRCCFRWGNGLCYFFFSSFYEYKIFQCFLQ